MARPKLTKIPKICRTCGKPIPGPNAHYFCSHGCQRNPNRRKMYRKCLGCGAEFWSRSSEKRYCSVACHKPLRFVDVPCSECGAVVTRKTSQAAKYPKTFCSRKCKAAYQHRIPIPTRTAVTLPCATCGKPVVRTPATIMKRAFCSLACAAAIHFGKRENHHMWRGGNHISRYPPEFSHRLRKEIRIRDGNMCCVCKATPEGKPSRHRRSLEIHHRDEDKTNNRAENLITLCCACHKKVHMNRLSLLP